MTTIETERLVLRPFLAGDVAAYHAYMSDPDVLRYTAMLPMSWDEARQSVEEIADWQAKATKDPPTSFVITLKETGALIGNCRLARVKENPQQADVAYFLNQNYWNRGYATESLAALIDYGFKNFDMASIIAFCVPENPASFRVMQKAGMVETDSMTLYAANGNFYRGEFRDVTYRRCIIFHPEL